MGALARGARPDLVRVAPARRARDRRGPLREGDRADRGRRPGSGRLGGTATATRVRFAVDEAVRRETTLEKMAALQPAFIPDGVVTAGNSSQIVDGSAAVLVASEAKVSELGLEPRARFVSFGVVGRRSAPDAPRQPGGIGEGAREGGADVGRHRRGRGQRGVRVGRAASSSRTPGCRSATRRAT